MKSVFIARYAGVICSFLSLGAVGSKQPLLTLQNTTHQSPPAWVCEVVPLLQKEHGDIPLAFLLGWIKVESNGRNDEVTTLNERGYFQLMKSESDDLGLEHERLTTDKEYSLRAGLRLATSYGHTAEAYGFARSDSELFWRMVKLIHAMGPGSVKKLVAVMQANEVAPSSWEIVKKFSVDHRAELLKTIKHDPVKWTTNVDQVLAAGSDLDKLVPNCPSG